MGRGLTEGRVRVTLGGGAAPRGGAGAARRAVRAGGAPWRPEALGAVAAAVRASESGPDGNTREKGGEERDARPV